MSSTPQRSLKSLNFTWLVALATADAVLLALFVAPEVLTKATATQLGLYRGLSAALLPVLVLLLVNLVPSNVKAMLVYWKPLGVLPGCEAFTRYGPADPRIDMGQLKKNVGALPTAPDEQNTKWYKLYRQVESRTEVASAQKDFLLYRDMSVLSLTLLALGPIGMQLLGAGPTAAWWTAAIFASQYVVATISARHAGVRFVCNVLAIHSVTKITAPKAVAS